MTTRAVVHDAPVSADTRATVSFVLIGLAALILFMSPRYLVFRLEPIPWPLQLGDWSDPNPSRVEPWQVGDYGQLRHLRYADGSTCTQALTGPLLLIVCR